MFPVRTLYKSILFFAILTAAAAAPVEDFLTFLTAEEKARLMEDKELVIYADSAPAFRLLPPVSLAPAIQNEFEGYDPNVSDEALFLLPKNDEENLLYHIYSKIRNIRSLSGIQYHSNHYKIWKTLFDNVFETGEIGSDVAVPTVLPAFAPAEERIIIHIEDVNFGDGYYEAAYINSTDAAVFGMKNLTSLKYKHVPLISKEKVRFQMAIIPTDEYLLVYGVCGVKAGSLIQKMIHIPSSFYTRMKALRDWFSNQIYE